MRDFAPAISAHVLNTGINTETISLAGLLERARDHEANYLQRTAGVSHERKGIRSSELFFLYVAIADREPARILESGRARAQSTLVLARLFPQTAIISIESDASSPDVGIATERLKPYGNVDCRFGDSRQLLPELLRPGDVILIDGPKDFRALKLALRLLRTGKPRAVFVHDLWLGLPARRFVDRYLRTAFLSDDPEWVRQYSHLDSSTRTPPSPTGHRRAYGATFACLPAARDNYSLRLLQCNIAEALDRIRETVRKIFRRPPRVRPADF